MRLSSAFSSRIWTAALAGAAVGVVPARDAVADEAGEDRGRAIGTSGLARAVMIEFANEEVLEPRLGAAAELRSLSTSPRHSFGCSRGELVA
jgi:hypothetical protein